MRFRILLAFMILLAGSAAQASIWLKMDPEKGGFVDQKDACGSTTHRKMILSTFVEEAAIILDAKKNTFSVVKNGGIYSAHESMVRSGRIYDSPRIETAFGWPAFGIWKYDEFTVILRVAKDYKVEISFILIKDGHKCYDKWSGQAKFFKNV